MVMGTDPGFLPPDPPVPAAYGQANQVFGLNSAGSAGEYKTITAGVGVTVTHTANNIAIASSGVSEVINPKDAAYGAYGDADIYGGGHDDTAAFQRAMAQAIATKGRIVTPPGKYLLSQIDFRNVPVISNGDQFGIEFLGSGMGTMFIHDGSTASLFEMNTANNIRVRMGDFQIYDVNHPTPSRIGINLGALTYYSELFNIRSYGFRTALMFNRLTQLLRMTNIYIRGCGRYGISATSGASNINTLWLGGYVDNCGRDSLGGGAQYPAVYLYQWAASQIITLIIEGNYASSFALEGGEGDNCFQGLRIEESAANQWALSGNLSEVNTGTYHNVFRDGYFAFPGSSYNIMTVDSPVLFDNTTIKDTDNSGADPFNLSGNGNISVIRPKFVGCATTSVSNSWP